MQKALNEKHGGLAVDWVVLIAGTISISIALAITVAQNTGPGKQTTELAAPATTNMF